MAAFQQPVGLPAGNQAGLDQVVGDQIGVAGQLVAAFRFSSDSAASSWSSSTNRLRRTKSRKVSTFNLAMPAQRISGPILHVQRAGPWA